jgi:hypothetical protein
MEAKVKQEGDIEKINKITGYQLPNKFKIVGLVLFIVSILAIVSSIKIYFTEVRWQELFERIAQTGMVLGLLMISISKEKIEDELVAKLRMQSYNYAVIGTVVFYLIIGFVNYAIIFVKSSASKMDGSTDIAVLGFLLTVQILTFRSLKKAYNEE